MLFMLFELGAERYALDVGQVAEVLPLVHVKPIPQAPAGIAGVLNYHGELVPVIDLGAMLLGLATPRRLSTRIILARYSDDSGTPRLLGLIAAQAITTLRRDDQDFAACGVAGAPYLGPVAADADADAGGMVQRIVVRHLLSTPVREALFQQMQEAQ